MSTLVTSDLVKSAIAVKLSTAFPNTDIYKEQVVEGMTYPSFFINQISVYPRHILRNKYIYTFLMNINYFEPPEDMKLYKKLENVGIDLIEIIDYIQVGDFKIKGKNKSSQKSDGVMVFSVEFDIPCAKVEDNGSKMMTLILDENIK